MSLLELTYANTSAYCPQPLEGKVVKVYDGDTLWLACVIDDTACRVCIRMHGYDTAEMRTRDAVEKKVAMRARDALRAIVLDKIVSLTVNGHDKYGRLIARLDVDGVDVNQYMTDVWGVPYDGGTKLVTDWSKFPKIDLVGANGFDQVSAKYGFTDENLTEKT